MNRDATVFIVDDDQTARDSVAALVTSMGVKAETFPSAEEFLNAYDRSRPGCLVTDVRMLGMDGLALQERLVREGVSLPAIVVSAYADVPLAVRAMSAGAVTVLEKPCRNHELWENIRQAINLDAKNRRAQARTSDIHRRMGNLTHRERRLIDLLLAGLPNKAIANKLDIGLRTVERRRHNILEKMQVETLAQLVALVAEINSQKEPN